jgi:hypothetical protein
MFDYALKKSELKVFQAAVGGKTGLSEIAGDAGVSVSRCSQLLASLAEKDFLSYERKGRLRVAAVSNAKHASLLKSLAQSGYNIADVFSYSKLDILFSLLPAPKTLSNLADETRLAPETLRKYARELKYLAVLFETPEKKISLSPNPSLEDFLREYLSYVNRRIVREIHRDAALLWEHGREIILRVPLPHGEVKATPTGITAMSSYGIDIVSNYGYYYYAPFDYELRKEDIALHTVLAGRETRNMSYALLLLKTGCDREYLIGKGREYMMEELAEEMTAYLEGKEVGDPIFPLRKEFDILCRQYGVR